MYLCKLQKPLVKKLINICTMIEKYKTLLEEFPFLTVIEYAGNEYLGIMQNIDNHIATMYVYDRLGSNAERQSFLRLGDEWWWETNRKLPINIALLNRWPFSATSQSFNIKQNNNDFFVIGSASSTENGSAATATTKAQSCSQQN